MQTNKKTIRKDKSVRCYRPDYRYLQLVMAPDIPASEVEALEAHWREAIADPKYTVVTNYELRVDQFCWDAKKEFLSVVAPSIPTPALRALKKRIKAAVRSKNGIVVVNYDVTAFTRPASGTVH
jgi:hypothetical protein